VNGQKNNLSVAFLQHRSPPKKGGLFYVIQARYSDYAGTIEIVTMPKNIYTESLLNRYE